jgi:hypothetical protein
MKTKDSASSAKNPTRQGSPERDAKDRDRGEDGGTAVVLNPPGSDPGKPRGGNGPGKGER